MRPVRRGDSLAAPGAAAAVRAAVEAAHDVVARAADPVRVLLAHESRAAGGRSGGSDRGGGDGDEIRELVRGYTSVSREKPRKGGDGAARDSRGDPAAPRGFRGAATHRNWRQSPVICAMTSSEKSPSSPRSLAAARGRPRARRPARSPARPAGRGRGRGRIGKRVAANMLERRRRRALPTRARSGSRRAAKTWRRGPVRARADRRGRERVPAGAGARGTIPRARPPRCAFWFRARPDVEKISESASAKIPTRISPRSPSRPRQIKVSNMKVRGDSREPILVSILKKSPSRVSFSSSFWFVSSTLKTPKSPHTH